MLDRAKQLKILVASYDRALRDVETSLEALETGTAQRTAYSTMARAFSTMKHDALTLQLTKLGSLAGACQTIVERAMDQKLGLPLDVLRAAAKELNAALATIAAGGRHELDRKLVGKVTAAAKEKRVDAE